MQKYVIKNIESINNDHPLGWNLRFSQFYTLTRK